MVKKKTYWENGGRYKSYDNKLWKTYIPNAGVNLTGNNVVDNAIVKFRNASKKYRRFYNDGDEVPEASVHLVNDDYTPEMEKRLEQWMDKIILETWVATKHATVKVKLKGYTGTEALY